MKPVTELILENEQLLRGIEVRQSNLNKLSTYLSELESQLALLFAASPDIIVFLDKEAKILRISEAAFTILGYKKEELVGRYIWDFISKTDIEQTRKHFSSMHQSKIVSTDIENSLINHWISKNGILVRLVWRFTVCDDRENQTIGIATDVTHFGLNEKYNLKLLQRAVDLSTDGIVVTDAETNDNVMIYVNNSFEKITGYSKEELLGKNCRFLQTEDTKQSRAIKTLRKCIINKKGCDVLLQNYKKNGDVFYNHLSLSTVVEKGVTVNFIGIIKDVTDSIGVDFDWSPNTESGFCDVR